MSKYERGKIEASIITYTIVAIGIFMLGHFGGAAFEAEKNAEPIIEYVTVEKVVEVPVEVPVMVATDIDVVSKEPEFIGTFTATAYCPCEACCGEWSDGITASGKTAKAGHTIAADWSVLPNGTEVIINGETYTVEDTGSAIKGNRIDIYFDRHVDALEFGRQEVEVYAAR